MANRGYQIIKGFYVLAATLAAVFFPVCGALASSLNGRILLQVEDKGQAWYINPLNSQRYYLGRPDDAFKVMRSLGLGVSNDDLSTFLRQAPRSLSGRILLQVEDKGQAYYVDPVQLKLYYLGRPIDAFNVMRQRGLGISNRNLAIIKIAAASGADSATLGQKNPIPTKPFIAAGTSHNFSFKFKNLGQSLALNLSAEFYKAYQTSPKVYSYPADNPPPDIRDAFYGLFFEVRAGDYSLDNLISQAKAYQAANNLSDDETAEFLLAVVQYIPYDQAKADLKSGLTPYYPYETLYLDKGICSDKTFLAVALLRRLGYGAAVLDFPDINHTAVGISCPKEESINASGYCYVETTNYFPFGIIPQGISGQAKNETYDFSRAFNPSGLGKIEIKQATVGRQYQSLTMVKNRIAAIASLRADLDAREAEMSVLDQNLKAQEAEVNSLKQQMDIYYQSGQISQYNSLISSYNNLVDQYNISLNAYRTKVNEYNAQIKIFNQLNSDFFQF